jgi:hypothetical protein
MAPTKKICPECGVEFYAMHLGRHMVKEHGAEPAVKAAPAVVIPEIVEQEGGEAYAERTPTDPKAEKKKDGGLLGKLWGNKDDKISGGNPDHAIKGTAERRPAAPKRRASTAGFWGDLVGPVSAVSARAGYVPMARAMEWSSPVVGEIIEDATKGTLVDRGIQPFVRNSEKWSELFDLLGFWGAIGMAQRNPAQAPVALDFARKRLVNLLPRIAANIKKERAKERQAVDALIELMPDIRELFPEMGPNDDPVALLIQSLFAAPAMEEEPVHA